MPVVSVSMPDELLARLDGVAEEYEYTGRSEVVREGTRTLLSEFDDPSLEGRPLAGTVAVFSRPGGDRHDHHVGTLRHEYEATIVSSDHSHVGGCCLDLFVLEGQLETISTFVGTCRALEGVSAVEYSLTPLDDLG
ncbi:CopG family ribbon-helix-helix protein [Natrarchaeobaculum aegyptiacum]|uniref:Nickel-responsive regulator n=1 Tax=Natrarchaeobaculum aegyptiacum TaxID=745377 RepID=A0A2Z2HRI2_9EURY|nr:CopG family ribbon-helix-helix protein [Natrarchaeobaculum aegyptiacum]ARS89662.1 nickel-responsive regulator [Natrarchaeobaculum aegyptiacum]